MYTIKPTSKFKKDFKTIVKRGYDITLLQKVIEQLANARPLEVKYKDHNLGGNWIGYRECHIEPDWLLIYKIDRDMLVLTRTGTHSDLF